MDYNIIKEIDLDFYNRKNVIVEAKQYDRLSRYILVTCYNQGSIFRLDSSKHFVFIRYKKSDENGVFNSCTITEDGKILAELTEQMIAVSGNCYADIVVTTGEVTISDNGELKDISKGTIVSTMNFCVHVIPTALDNSEIESSYEFNALNNLIANVTKDYEYVIENAQQNADHAAESERNAKESENNAAQSAKAAATSKTNAESSETNAKKSETSAQNSAATATNKAKEASGFAIKAESYAHGGTGTRTGEDTDNGLYYKNQASNSASAAKSSEDNAKTSEENAANSASTAATKANAASTSATNAATSATTAGTKASEAATSASNAAESATTATQKATAAGTSATNAANSAASAADSANTATNKAGEAADSAESAANSAITAVEKANAASASKDSAAISAINADNYAKKSQSYAVGTGGEFRENDDSDCAEYYYEQTKRISQGFSGVVSMGTITFDDLSNPDNQQLNYMFNISDSFVSDDRFADGGGMSYGAGSNVVYTAEGMWDVLAAAMVSGVKGGNETEYRQGFVNLTAENVGALPVDGNAISATNADKIDGYHISVVSALPSDAASHTDTFYVI